MPGNAAPGKVIKFWLMRSVTSLVIGAVQSSICRYDSLMVP